ncbi:MAG: Gfo/Idh/MocA family oxidoreductase [Armatimonadota bacterium]|jgi:predicted dehydrogenase
MGGDRLGIGVIGTGGWARGFWNGAQHAPETELVACWDQVAESAREFGETHHCQPVASLDALLGDPRVEAAAIFTPNNAHRAPAEAAAAAGKHVFTEKPIANSIADAASIIRACRKAGVTLMVGHSSRYAGASRALKAIVTSGRLGQLAMVEVNHSHSGGTRVTAKEWRWHRDEAPGGPLMQLAVHDFDTLHYLFGPVRRATALSTDKLVGSEIEDVFLSLLEFQSGLLAYVGTSYISPYSSFTRIYGAGGNAYSENGRITLIKVTGPSNAEEETITPP